MVTSRFCTRLCLSWNVKLQIMGNKSLKFIRPSLQLGTKEYNILEKHLWNSFLLYLLGEILQLVHEITSTWNKRENKTPQSALIKTRSSQPELFCQNTFLKVQAMQIENALIMIAYVFQKYPENFAFYL